ncbi:MAG: amidohydrolase family protein [Actinomycetota bacterium]
MEPGSDQWLAQHVEDVIDPDRPIIDPHHHLWPADGALPYGLTELHGDTEDGHRIQGTVFVECGAAYRTDGPDHLRPVGETAFVAEQAERSDQADGAPILGIVGRADLRLDGLDEVLDAHAEAGRGRFRGIRHALARAPEPDVMRIPGRAPAGLAQDPAFRAGVVRLGQRGLVYDSWHYHHQIDDFTELAAATPETTMVLDHVGTPIGVGRYAGQRDEVFADWSAAIDRAATRPNIVVKLGGLAMPDNGFGWDRRDRPATSEELVAAQARYYHHVIERFGPDRCMFESNFPVDRWSLSYRTFWNSCKRLAVQYSPAEQDRMFRGTAAEVYGLAVPAD